jgi:hypothetical protein
MPAVSPPRLGKTTNSARRYERHRPEQTTLYGPALVKGHGPAEPDLRDGSGTPP